MNIHINTPEGTRDRLFSECLERRQVQSALVELFRRRGYTEVITPEVEFYDLFVQSGNPIPQESMLKIIDRSGKIMVMRPDCTAPIARVAATKLKNLALPQRLYYDQTVFRSGQAHQGGSNEIAQCGVEMIGAVGEKADLEMVAMAGDACRCCGLRAFHIWPVSFTHLSQPTERASYRTVGWVSSYTKSKLYAGRNCGWC